MKKFLIILTSLILVFSFVGCQKNDKNNSEGKKEETKIVDNKVGITTNFEDKVALKVNGKDIMLSRVNTMIFDLKQSYFKDKDDAYWDQEDNGMTVEERAKDNLKTILMDGSLLYNWALEKGITVPEEEIKLLDEQIVQLYNMETITQELVNKTGMSRNAFKELYVERLYVSKFFEKMLEEIEVDQAKVDELLKNDPMYQKIKEIGVDKFKDQVRARHILIKTVDETGAPFDEEKKAEALKKIEGILERAKNGEDFATLAKEFTEDPGSKENGGEYTFSYGKMVPEFEKAAFSLKEGEISDVVETTYGYHIIKTEEFIPATEEAKKEAENELKSIEERAEKFVKNQEFEKHFEEYKKDKTSEVVEEVWKNVSFK